MRTIPKVRWGRVVMIVVGSALFIIGMMYALILGVVDCSLKQYPPTDAELQEDPSLVRYLPEGDPRIKVYAGGSDE